MTSPTSQNGWPALTANSPLLYTWRITDDTNLRLRNGSAGFLLAHYARWMDARVKDIDNNYNNGATDDWGYSYRPIRGYDTGLSNHASGTAEDLNATDHPLGERGTFTEHEQTLIHNRLHLYEGCLRWGGDYVSRADEMHVEINQPLAVVERVARKLMDTPRGRVILNLNPTQKAVILS